MKRRTASLEGWCFFHTSTEVVIKSGDSGRKQIDW